MEQPLIITIAKQYGVSGKEIASALAKSLAVHFYDHAELIARASAASHIPKARFLNASEKPGIRYYGQNPLTVSGNSYAYLKYSKFVTGDDLVQAQFTAILNIAEEKESCVILGHCADHVLKAYKNKISVFLYAPADARQNRIMTEQHISKSRANHILKKIDRINTKYYQYFTGRDWNSLEYYDLCINTTALSQSGTVSFLKDFLTASAKKELGSQASVLYS